jgi:hypothetical protein
MIPVNIGSDRDVGVRRHDECDYLINDSGLGGAGMRFGTAGFAPAAPSFPQIHLNEIDHSILDCSQWQGISHRDLPKVDGIGDEHCFLRYIHGKD